MSKETQRVALLAAVKGFWPSAFGPIAYPNAPFTVPETSRWAEVFIMSHSTDRASLGHDFLKRNFGSLQFNLYVPRGVGSKENTTAADEIESYFEESVFVCSDGDTITFGTPHSFLVDSVEERREGTNANWSRYVVDCPFRRDAHVIK